MSIVYYDVYGRPMYKHEADEGIDLHYDAVPLKLLETFIVSVEDVIQKLDNSRTQEEYITWTIMSVLQDFAKKQILTHPLHKKNNEFLKPNRLLKSNKPEHFPHKYYDWLEEKAKAETKLIQAMFDQNKNQDHPEVVKGRITYGTLRIVMDILSREYHVNKHHLTEDKYNKLIDLFDNFKPKGEDNFTEMFYDMLTYVSSVLSHG